MQEQLGSVDCSYLLTPLLIFCLLTPPNEGTCFHYNYQLRRVTEYAVFNKILITYFSCQNLIIAAKGAQLHR